MDLETITPIDSAEADARRFAFWFSPKDSPEKINNTIHEYLAGLNNHESIDWWRGYIDRLMNK